MAATSRSPARCTSFYEQLYNHIALPRDVPGREDKDPSVIEAALLTRLNDATQLLSSHVAQSDQQHIRALSGSLTACQSLHVDRAITKPAVLRELRALQSGRVLILHVSAQNCGLLIYTDFRSALAKIFIDFVLTRPVEVMTRKYCSRRSKLHPLVSKFSPQRTRCFETSQAVQSPFLKPYCSSCLSWTTFVLSAASVHGDCHQIFLGYLQSCGAAA